MKLYFANLAKYNEGFLVGDWYDLEDYTDVDDLMNDVCIQVLGQKEDEDGQAVYEYPADEEWAVHDYDAPFTMGEYPSLSDIQCMIDFSSLDEDNQLKVSFLQSGGYCADLGDCIRKVDEVNFYKGQTLSDVAYDLVEDGCFGDVGDGLKGYIDYDAIGRDLGFDNYTEESEGVYEVCF